MDDKLKQALPYIEVLAGFLGTILILFIVFDNWILPSMVKDRKVVEVPKLISMKFDDATELLRSVGLDYTVVSQQYNENYPKNYVIKQNPSPGTKVKESRQILLTISKGIESVSVPYLINKQETNAKNELINAELNIGNIVYEMNDSIPKGVVIRQNPSAGAKVGYNANVDLVISSGGEDAILVPDLHGKSFNEAQIILGEVGLRLGEVSYQKNETFIPNTIIKQIPAKGDTVHAGTLINIYISK
jgi:serine/threonine-protein kinase